MADPTATLNPVKKDPYVDDDDDDNVILAFSRKTNKPKSEAERPLISLSNKMATTKKKLDIKQEEKPCVTKKEPKKETGSDIDDEEGVPLSLLRKKKPSNNLKVSNGKVSTKGLKVEAQGKKTSKIKEEKVDDDEFELDKPLRKVRKEDVKRKKKKMSSKEMDTANGKVKKVYSLPGQKVDPPEERDPLRIFYETLHQQVPSSEMAAVWMMERGLLPEKEAAIIYAKKQKSRQQQIKSPVKVISASKVPNISAKKPKEEPKALAKKPKEEPKESTGKSNLKPTKKRKDDEESEDEDDDDDDFVLPLKKMRK